MKLTAADAGDQRGSGDVMRSDVIAPPGNTQVTWFSLTWKTPGILCYTWKS